MSIDELSYNIYSAAYIYTTTDDEWWIVMWRTVSSCLFEQFLSHAFKPRVILKNEQSSIPNFNHISWWSVRSLARSSLWVRQLTNLPILGEKSLLSCLQERRYHLSPRNVKRRKRDSRTMSVNNVRRSFTDHL